MNHKRRTTVLLTKSCFLCLIIVLVGCIPATTPRPNESATRFFVGHPMISNPHEDVDAILEVSPDGRSIEKCELSFSGTLDSVNVNIGESLFIVNELRNEQSVFAGPSCLTNTPQNSEPGGLPNGGGGGGGGRRRIQQGML